MMVQGGLRFIVASIINSTSWLREELRWLGVERDEWTCILGGGPEEGIMALGRSGPKVFGV